MLDEKILDRMNFAELSQALNLVLEKIRELKDDSEDGDDPRLDLLYVFANKIVRRVNSIIRENSFSNPEALVQWRKLMDSYEERYDKFTDFFLDEDIVLDTE